MILLDTDHVSVLQLTEGERTKRLKERLTASGEPTIGVAIITIEEQMRGWLSAIAKERQPRRQIAAYRNLAELFTFYSHFLVAPWDDAAVECLEKLPSSCQRIGTMDRKIAAISIANGALFLTANSQDFAKVPGLKFENWLD